MHVTGETPTDQGSTGVGKIAYTRRASRYAAVGDFAHPKPAKPEPNRVIIAEGMWRGRPA
jgi:hypothetical protein